MRATLDAVTQFRLNMPNRDSIRTINEEVLNSRVIQKNRSIPHCRRYRQPQRMLLKRLVPWLRGKMSSEAAIELVGLTKLYGGVRVVDGVSLRILPGTIFGFLGPNGAGKSTTVKMMTGLIAPDGGACRIMGKTIHQDALVVKKMIGVVPDGLALFEYLSIWEHLNLIRETFGLDDFEFKQRSTQLLQLLDLAGDVNQLAKRCSYGMRKKTSLAMALLPNPKVLLLDEPFEGLDPVMTVTVKRALRRAAQKGTTIFLTTHVLHAVSDLVQHYGIIRDGKLVSEGYLATLRQEGLTLEDAYLRQFEIPQEAELEWLG
jgi:ABC-2 type transport system ATP-binding protein